MKILFLTPQFPYPPHKGTTMRNYYLIANLARVTRLICSPVVESGEALRESPLHAMCRRIESVPVPAEVCHAVPPTRYFRPGLTWACGSGRQRLPKNWTTGWPLRITMSFKSKVSSLRAICCRL